MNRLFPVIVGLYHPVLTRSRLPINPIFIKIFRIRLIIVLTVITQENKALCIKQKALLFGNVSWEVK